MRSWKCLCRSDSALVWNVGGRCAQQRQVDAGAGYSESTFWARHRQGVNAGGIPGLADAAGAQVTELHVGLG